MSPRPSTPHDASFLTLVDGRNLAYQQWGDTQGDPVFFFHGSPGSRLEGATLHDAATNHGLRIIAVDRPGMGRSDFQPGRTLLDFPRDLAALAEELGLHKFSVIGWSAGGQYALACAHAIPDRVRSVISLAGWAPLDWDGATAAMDPVTRFYGRLSRVMPAGVFRVGFAPVGFMARWVPKTFSRAFRRQLCAADRDVLDRPGIVEMIIADTREAFCHGSRGAAHDALLCYRDWGFRLEDVAATVHIWQGTADTVASPAFGKRLAQALPGAIYHELPDEGHLFPFDHWDDVVRSIVEA